MFFFRRKRSFDGLQPPTPGLHTRILNTVLLVLAFRLLANIPLANVDEERMHALLAHNPFLSAIDLFAGGDVLRSFSIVAVGLFPYLIAGGFVQLGAWLIPALRRMRETEAGRERLKRYTRMATLPVAIVVAWGVTRYLSLQTGVFPDGLSWFTASEFWSTVIVVAAVTFGSWLTEKIKEAIKQHGIGKGEHVLLLVGSSLSLVTWTFDVIYGGDAAQRLHSLTLHAGLALFVILAGIPLLSTTRRIQMVSTLALRSRSRMGRAAESSRIHLPLPLNSGGIMPISSALGVLAIFQIAALAIEWAFPGRFASARQLLLAPTISEHGLYWAMLGVLTMAFTYLSNYATLWKPFANSDLSMAELLRRDPAGTFIAGIRPGAQTEAYLSSVMARITLPAAAMLAFLAAGVPYLVWRTTGNNVSAAILAELVFVRSLLEVQQYYRVYRLESEPYPTFIRKRA